MNGVGEVIEFEALFSQMEMRAIYIKSIKSAPRGKAPPFVCGFDLTKGIEQNIQNPGQREWIAAKMFSNYRYQARRIE